MAEEEIKNSIQLKLVRCRGLQGTKSGNLTLSAKVEFASTLLGDSPKVELNTESGFFQFDFTCSLDVSDGDTSMFDEIAKTPVVVTFNEILPKDKKAKEEKTNVLGQCCVDLFPLLRGSSGFSLVEPIHRTGAISEASATSCAEVEIEISTEKPLLTEEELESSNMMTICMESAFSLPESWNQVGTQYMYGSCLPIPVSSEKDAIVLFPGGAYRAAGEKEISEQRKWSFVPSASGSCLYIPNTEIHHCPYDEEDGDMRGKEDIEFREFAENHKPRVTWNTERRCFINSASGEHVQQNIAQFRRWPLEIVRSLQPGTGKTKGKEEESVISYHGVAYIDLAPLIYPGVNKIHGAYLLHPYNETEMQNELNRKTAINNEIKKNIFGINRSSSSLGGKSAGKALGKNENKGKQHSVGNIKQDTIIEGVEENVPADLEGQEYVEARSYIIVEIELEKPFVPKRKFSEVLIRVAELIPPRPPFPKKQDGSDKVIREFERQIGKSANMLLEEFRKLFGNVKFDQKVEDAEERRRLFYYQLNSSGKYFALKEQLKYFVIKIVREKFMYTTSFSNPEEMQEFITKLYLFLLDHMQQGLNNYLDTEEVAEVPPPMYDSNLLKQFAHESEIMFKYDVAAKYYQERIARNTNDAECHLDYGIFCLLIGDKPKAEECFKEAVSLQQQYVDGLMLCAAMSLDHEEFQRAEDLFDAATYIKPEHSLPWTLLGLFYSGVENIIMAERSFNQANKCNTFQEETETDESGEKKVKVQESIYLMAARYLLDCHLLQMSERALAHELTANDETRSVTYFILLSELQIERKQYSEALESLEQALVLKHDNPRAWALKGHVFFILKELDDSRQCYERSLSYKDVDSGENIVYLKLANVYLQQEMYEEAKKIYLHLCKHAPSCVSWLGVGIACYRMNQLDEAEYALNEANISDNHDGDVWAYLTLVSLKNKKHIQSQQCYKYSMKCGNIDESLAKELNDAIKQIE